MKVKNITFYEDFLKGGGMMGELIRTYDWSQTAIGSIQTWPQSLRTAISIVLNSNFPMFIWWGEDTLINFYNDSYAEILGKKHPAALGKSGHEAWSEIWDDIGPLASNVFTNGNPIYMKDLPLVMNRYGFDEETFFTFSYSCIRDESGSIGGLYCVCVETTNELKARREIEESEERFRTMAEGSDILIGVADENSNATYFNLAWERLTGRPVADLLQLGWADLIHPEDREPFIAICMDALKRKTAFEGEFRVQSHDGSYRWIFTKGPVRLRPDGSFAGHISSSIDITDLKNALADQQRLKSITEERNALAFINKTKDDFIALASHQLRTPATAVKQYAGLLLSNYAGPLNPNQRELLQIAYDSNERQLNIVHDLLKTAQLDSDKYNLNIGSHDITKLAKSAVDDLDTVFQAKSQTVSLLGAKAPIIVPFDEIEIKLVLLNLLENASKYSYANTKIKIQFEKRKHHIYISVIDSGVGINSTDFERVFDKFTRVNNALSDTVAGTGLGLYWCKRITELHKGSISVSSQVGEGSTFTIKLPL